mmetsp:Transcript_1064/g.3632  ORF Transcript_1064/g.3632 Transcript_1064/m.3632 type:complete len:151 (-) Transcript_1064:218-670(-)|eukprot:CAMPEP_0117444920 /NCGR_PEP_ID=MMETSP0759-20121206/5513_1 /TAXON_ID=63605 /ORGANISM="Percolomonas cosmopolitus, Strain WS" /LENGTH=150 /DNA_ID=CAMNT_0005237049 /DNA_START=6 /DNA_END=458 /DNA_ORIENTATION=+
MSSSSTETQQASPQQPQQAPSFPSQIHSLIQSHISKQNSLQNHISSLHSKTAQSLRETSQHLTYPLNQQIGTLFTQQQQIQQLQNDLSREISHMNKEMSGWEREREKIEGMMRSIGDVENWAKIIERDMGKLVTDADKLLGDAKRKDQRK